MPDSNSKSPSADIADAVATEWFVRRERGLNEAEQMDYAKWLRESPRHEATITHLEQVWKMMDSVFVGAACQGMPPHRDLLAPSKRRRFRLWIPLLAGAAAAAFLLLLVPTAPTPEGPAAAQGRVIVHPGPERLTLKDGSLVDLNAGAKVEVQFSATERRVTLVRGEAYFNVAKNPARPFIVSVSRVTVRAIGTAFCVNLDQGDVAVLVTHGRVRVNEIPPSSGGNSPPSRELSALVAGQKGVVHLPAAFDEAQRPEMKVTQLTQGQIERALLWQGLRLEFADMPLGDIVAEFNRYNRKKLLVSDAATAAIRVGGGFRVDNIDGFVRLLSVGFGVNAFPHGEEIMLRKTPKP